MIVALGEEGSEVDAEHPEHDGAGHDEDEEAPHVGHDAGHGGDACRGPGRARAGGRLVGHPGQEALERLGAVARDDGRDDGDEQDLEGPDDEVGDRRRRLRADTELHQQVVEPPAPLVHRAHQGRGERQEGGGHDRYSVPEFPL